MEFPDEGTTTRALFAPSILSLFGVPFSYHFIVIFSRVDALTQVEDACPLAALAALSFDANQLEKAEWCTAYPPVPLALSDHAVRRASALSPPPPPPLEAEAGLAKTMLKRMDAQTFSAFAAITYSAVGSERATMSMITDMARKEIEWQMFVKGPLSFINAVAIHAHRQRRRHPSLRMKIPTLPKRAGAGGNGNVRLNVVHPPAGTGASGPRDHARRLLGKRRRSQAEVAETETRAPDTPRPPPEKRAKRVSEDPYPFPPRLSAMAYNPVCEEGGGPDRRLSIPRVQPRPAPVLDEDSPFFVVRERLGARNVPVPSGCPGDGGGEGRGRALRRRP